MKKQLQSLLPLLNQGLVEREAVIKPVLLATLAGENPVLVGPPGTGKSLIARRIAQCFPNEGEEQGAYFEYLLTKFSTPEEIFGPLSISELKQDRFKRNTAGYLPSVRVAFLDEVFKASSSILNALLTILNERVYHNGAQVQRVPLQALIAASNELPTEHEELSALYDRFLLRVFVDYVGIEQLPALFAHTTEPEIPASLRLTQQQLTAIRSAADAVSIPDDIVKAVQQIWAEHQTAFKEDTRERLSDRRLKKLIHLMRVSAATNGRNAVDLSDVLLLKDSLWNHPDNREKIMALLRKVLGSYNQIIPVPAGQSAPNAKQGAVASVPASLPKKGTGQMDTVVKGYKGRGTEDDPLLIESAADLIDLARPEVGQKGYYFRQTKNIDLSNINKTDWPEINFHGYYDGAKFEIFDSHDDSEVDSISYHPLFAAHNGFLKNIRARCSYIAFCDGGTMNSIIGSIAYTGNFTLDCCEVKKITGFAYKLMHYFEEKLREDGLLTVNGSVIDSLKNSAKLFANGSLIGVEHDSFSVIDLREYNLTDTVISYQEWMTASLLTGHKGTRDHFIETINHNNKYRNHNNKIDRSIRVFDIDLQKSPGEFLIIKQPNRHSHFEASKIPSTQRTQRHFEHTLGFDFEKIWRWDDTSNAPVLRRVGVGAKNQKNGKTEQAADAGSVDLLSMQTQANIWL